jgi:hypothetical protein
MFPTQFAIEVFVGDMLLFHVLMQGILVFECFLAIKTAQAMIGAMAKIFLCLKLFKQTSHMKASLVICSSFMISSGIWVLL